MKKITILFLLIFISGCSLLNDVFIDQEKIFADSRDKDIGKKITTVYPTILNLKRATVINKSESEYHFGTKGYCQYAVVINKESKIIKSWKYISAKSKCEEGFWLFYEGPF